MSAVCLLLDDDELYIYIFEMHMKSKRSSHPCSSFFFFFIFFLRFRPIQRIAAAETRLKECEEALGIANRQFENELELLFEEERRREAEPGDWANAAQEEKEEDAREDEVKKQQQHIKHVLSCIISDLILFLFSLQIN